MNIQSRIDSTYQKYATNLGLGICLILPLKLSILYVFLFPALLLFLSHSKRRGIKWLLEDTSIVFRIYLLFLLCFAITSLFGLQPLLSISKLISLAFLSVTILFFEDRVKSESIFLFTFMLVLGQSIAALHSVIQASLPFDTPRLFLGAVTESGQLALTVLVAIGIAASEYYHPALPNSPSTRPSMSIGCINFVLLMACAFAFRTGYGWQVPLAISVIVGFSFIYQIISLKISLRPSKLTQEQMIKMVQTILLPLLVAALVVNLKRGPWAGAFFASILFLALFSRQKLIILLAVSTAFIGFIEPVRSRITQSIDHFFISGGRSAIWEVGSELATRYPLGIGYSSSPFLQKFDSSIPSNLEHFHSNLINILVEGGWIVLALFLWWIIVIIKIGVSKPTKPELTPISCGIACAIIAWQVAGIVEYNFGDSEVLLVALTLIGLVSGLQSKDSANKTQINSSSPGA